MPAPKDIQITPIVVVGEIVNVNLTVLAGKFYFNGIPNNSLQLVAGNTYIFDQSDLSNKNHKFVLSLQENGVNITGLKFFINGNEVSPNYYNYYLTLPSLSYQTAHIEY